MITAALVAACWLALATPVAVKIGRGIRLAEHRRFQPIGCPAGCSCEAAA